MFDNVIIIPYRDRKTQLEYFIENTVPLFEKYLPNSKVVVIEQESGKLFNRGALLNVGIKEYENKTKYFFTHDVDTIPNEDIVKNVYTYRSDIFRIFFVHNTSLGGIIKISHNVIFDINGFPNNIWGWGIEDRSLFFRSYIKNVQIKSNKKQSFKKLPHKSNKEIYTGEKKIISEKWTKKYIDNLNDIQKEDMIMSSGLNNIQYSIIERNQIHKIVELIKVKI